MIDRQAGTRRIQFTLRMLFRCRTTYHIGSLSISLHCKCILSFQVCCVIFPVMLSAFYFHQKSGIRSSAFIGASRLLHPANPVFPSNNKIESSFSIHVTFPLLFIPYFIASNSRFSFALLHLLKNAISSERNGLTTMKMVYYVAGSANKNT